METKEIVNHFAVLVGKTMFALKNKGVSINELIAVIEHSYARNGNKLIYHGSWRKSLLSAKQFECYITFGNFLTTKFLKLLSPVAAK